MECDGIVCPVERDVKAVQHLAHPQFLAFTFGCGHLLESLTSSCCECPGPGDCGRGGPAAPSPSEPLTALSTSAGLPSQDRRRLSRDPQKKNQENLVCYPSDRFEVVSGLDLTGLRSCSTLAE